MLKFVVACKAGFGAFTRSRTRPHMTISCRLMEPCVSRESGEPCNPLPATKESAHRSVVAIRWSHSQTKRARQFAVSVLPKPSPASAGPEQGAICERLPVQHRLYHTEETNNVRRLLTKNTRRGAIVQESCRRDRRPGCTTWFASPRGLMLPFRRKSASGGRFHLQFGEGCEHGQGCRRNLWRVSRPLEPNRSGTYGELYPRGLPRGTKFSELEAVAGALGDEIARQLIEMNGW